MGQGIGVDSLAAAAELDDTAAVALGGATFGEGSELLHRFALGGFTLAAFLALIGLSIERLRNNSGSANIRNSQDLKMEFAAFVLDAQHVSNMNFARRLGFQFVGADASEIAGFRCEAAGLEKACGPKPLVDTYRFAR